MTGTVITVQEDSPQAKLWGAGPAEAATPESGPEQGGADGADETKPPAGNATREAWAAYAGTLGIEVPEDWKREEIRSHVEQLLGGDED